MNTNFQPDYNPNFDPNYNPNFNPNMPPQGYNPGPAPMPPMQPNPMLAADYEADGTQIHLDADTVRRFIAKGDGTITDSELMYFLQLNKAMGLNPFLNDSYITKFRNSDAATIMVSIGAMEKRADSFPEYDGMLSGVIVLANGQLVYRQGCLVLPGESLVGGWAEVYRKDRSHPTHVEVSLNEFEGRKKNGEPNRMWSEKPATMIRKVAKATALREAFPNQNRGLYISEEIKGAEDAKPQPIPQEVIDRNTRQIEQPAPGPDPNLLVDQPLPEPEPMPAIGDPYPQPKQPAEDYPFA